MAFNGTGSNVTSLNASNIASGTLAVARGGTGTASPSIVAGSGISVSGTWPNQTIASSGGVTSLNGQTGAITNTGYGDIGSYVVAGTTSDATTAGSTYAGSTLVRNANALNIFNANNGNNWVSTTGAVNLGLTGTWRSMTSGTALVGAGFYGLNLFVRIS